jgi:hypothetical protein
MAHASVAEPALKSGTDGEAITVLDDKNQPVAIAHIEVAAPLSTAARRLRGQQGKGEYREIAHRSPPQLWFRMPRPAAPCAHDDKVIFPTADRLHMHRGGISILSEDDSVFSNLTTLLFKSRPV